MPWIANRPWEEPCYCWFITKLLSVGWIGWQVFKGNLMIVLNHSFMLYFLRSNVKNIECLVILSVTHWNPLQEKTYLRPLQELLDLFFWLIPCVRFEKGSSCENPHVFILFRYVFGTYHVVVWSRVKLLCCSLSALLYSCEWNKIFETYISCVSSEHHVLTVWFLLLYWNCLMLLLKLFFPFFFKLLMLCVPL